jgi:NADPH:quinone reductase
MKSYWTISDDTGSRMELRDVATPQPGAGQVLVKMHAASLNRGEFIHGHGLHAAGSAKALAWKVRARSCKWARASQAGRRATA